MTGAAMKLSEKIRILRKARGMSQEEFGYSLSEATNGVTRQTVSDWENGKFEPKLDNIRDMVRVLNVSFDVLLDETIDLNDAETLEKVLNASSQNSQNPTLNRVTTYYIRAYDVQCGAIIGELNDTQLMLYNYYSAGNSIRFPLDRVKDIQLGENATEQHGKLVITLYASEKSITSVEIESPREVIAFYRKLMRNV